MVHNLANKQDNTQKKNRLVKDLASLFNRSQTKPSSPVPGWGSSPLRLSACTHAPLAGKMEWEEAASQLHRSLLERGHFGKPLWCLVKGQPTKVKEALFEQTSPMPREQQLIVLRRSHKAEPRLKR